MRGSLFVWFLFWMSLAQAQVLPVTELIGDFNPAGHPAFVEIASNYTDKSSIYLRQEAYTAFVQMAGAAKQAGFKLKIISATRNFSYQKSIWERKWEQPKYMGWSALERSKDILKYSSMPGSSRHHWGTDIDLNALDNAWFETGEGKRLYAWLCANAPSYGFYQVYTSKATGRTGYEEEKWHWSYMPLAERYLQQYNTLIDNHMLGNFKGSETAVELKIVERYVNGIHPSSKTK